MITTLRTSYRDTRAHELSWTLDLAPIDPLAALDVRLDGLHLQLRLLGSSHQVLVDSPLGRGSETVACFPGLAGTLPAAASRRLGGWDYAFTASVHADRAASFDRRVEELVRSVEAHPQGIAGVFPGVAGALTAVVVDRGVRARGQPVTWSTWHSYPQTGELVVTRTWLTRP